MPTPWLQFSRVKTAKRTRSIEVRSAKMPMGLVRLGSSRKRRSMALVVLAALRHSDAAKRKALRRSSRPWRRQATAFG